MTRPNTHPDAIDRTIAAYYLKAMTERGYPPSFREIGEHIGMTSKSSVQRRLQHCVAAGLIPGYRRASVRKEA